MSENEITHRIRRDELLDLLHSTVLEKEMDSDGDGWDDWEQPQPVTARMPAVTLENLLIPDELPQPPFVIRFRSPAGTDRVSPLVFGVPVVDIPQAATPANANDGAVTDDNDPDISIAMSRVTSNAFDATITAAIDAAVAELVDTPVEAALSAMEAEDRRTTAVIARAVPPTEHMRMFPMLCGFALTFVAGIGIMFLIS